MVINVYFFRVGLYKKLLALGYYVLAVDYRGYGDSTVISPTEASCVMDARAALAWLTAKLGDRVKVVVWGHSLGTAIASHMVSEGRFCLLVTVCKVCPAALVIVLFFFFRLLTLTSRLAAGAAWRGWCWRRPSTACGTR